MSSHSAPSNRWFTIEFDQLEGCAPIRPGERPGYLPDARCVLHALDPELGRPMGKRTITTGSVRAVDVTDRPPEEGTFVGAQPRIVSDKRLGGLILQTEPSRSARKASASA